MTLQPISEWSDEKLDQRLHETAEAVASLNEPVDGPHSPLYKVLAELVENIEAEQETRA